MAKRRSNVYCSPKHSSDSELNRSDSEDDSYEPVIKKRIRAPGLGQKRIGSSKGIRLSYPKEDNEHTYSSTPIFSNISRKRNQSNGYSSESDCENSEMPSACMSERSTSIDSVKYDGSGRSIRSDVDVERLLSGKRRPKCHSKNALMARMNRQKKKEYVEKLEGEINFLKENNNDLKSKLDEQGKIISELKSQVRYLHSALANSKEIGSILRKVCSTKTNLKLTSSLLTSPSESNMPDYNVQGTNLCSLYEKPSVDECSSVNNSGSGYSPEYFCNKYDSLENLTSDYCNNSSLFDNAYLSNYVDIDDWMSAIDTVEDFDTIELPKLPPAETDETEPLDTVGVCVHVSKNQVSFEFCERCNHNALHGLLNDNGLPVVN